jgi:zona occludens toxin
VIHLVDGTPGAGKTYFAMRAIEDAVTSGKVVCTNVRLAPDWAYRVAGANPLRRFRRGARRRRAELLEARVLVSEDLDELFRVRARGHGEGRAVMVLDEAHRWMNSRNWNAGDRGRIVDWMTAHRHYGFDVYLVTQYIEMIDKQVRALVEYRVRLRNLRRMKVAGISVLPFNCFAAITELEGGTRGQAPIVKRDFYRLNRRVAGIYDTHALSAVDARDDVIVLPRQAGAAPPGRPAQPDLVPHRPGGALRPTAPLADDLDDLPTLDEARAQRAAAAVGHSPLDAQAGALDAPGAAQPPDSAPAPSGAPAELHALDVRKPALATPAPLPPIDADSTVGEHRSG